MSGVEISKMKRICIMVFVICSMLSFGMLPRQAIAKQEIPAPGNSQTMIFGIRERALDIGIGGFVANRQLYEFVRRFSARFLGEATDGASTPDKFVMLSVGQSILELGTVKDDFVAWAPPSVRKHLKSKTFEANKCNIERLTTSSGQRISWVVVETDDRSIDTATKCFLIAVSLYLDFDLLEVSDMTSQDLENAILDKSREH